MQINLVCCDLFYLGKLYKYSYFSVSEFHISVFTFYTPALRPLSGFHSDEISVGFYFFLSEILFVSVSISADLSKCLRFVFKNTYAVVQAVVCANTNVEQRLLFALSFRGKLQ